MRKERRNRLFVFEREQIAAEHYILWNIQFHGISCSVMNRIAASSRKTAQKWGIKLKKI